MKKRDAGIGRKTRVRRRETQLPRMMQYRLARCVAACGLERVHFHTLRHTFATRCVEAACELKSLSEVLGHASTAVTLDLYVHATLEHKRANLEKLEALA